jgi:hypothetical protein
MNSFFKTWAEDSIEQQTDSLLAHHLRQNHRSKHSFSVAIPPQQSPGIVNSVTIGIKVGLLFLLFHYVHLLQNPQLLHQRRLLA